MEERFTEGVFLINHPDKPARYGKVNLQRAQRIADEAVRKVKEQLKLK